MNQSCKHWGICGGCDLNPQTGALFQIEDKRELLKERLQEFNIPAIEAIRCEEQQGQRRRALIRLHCYTDKLTEAGFFNRGSHDLLALDSCIQLRSEFQVLLKVLNSYQATFNARIRLSVDLYTNAQVSHIAIQFHVVKDTETSIEMIEAELKSFLRNTLEVPLLFVDERSEPLYCEEDQRYFAPGGFRQNNAAMNRVLRDYISNLAQRAKAKTILDLGCGNGNLSLGLGDSAHLYLVDSDPKNIAALRANIVRLGIASSHVWQMRFTDFLQLQKTSSLASYDLLIANPPRAGFAGCAQELATLAAQTIIYVSCNADSLKDDLRIIVANGYCISQLCVLDMFPMTKHWETIVLLQRDNTRV